MLDGLRKVSLLAVKLGRHQVEAPLTLGGIRRSFPMYGYPPDRQGKATQTVLEQAELLCRDRGVQAGTLPRLKVWHLVSRFRTNASQSQALWVAGAYGMAADGWGMAGMEGNSLEWPRDGASRQGTSGQIPHTPEQVHPPQWDVCG